MPHDLAVARDLPQAEGRWRATLDLRVEQRPSGSLLTHCRHSGPLRVQRPFYPEGPGVCHVCLLHPPGGLVPGDELAIDVALGPGARALVTTPAAAKIYRSDGRRAIQNQHLAVAEGAFLEWLPQETIVFDGAISSTATAVDLAPGARFVGWDVLCLGRPAIGERFRSGACTSRFEIHRAGVPLYVEAAAWEGGSDVLSGRYGLGGHCAFGTMLAVGEPELLRDLPRELASPGEGVSSTLLARGEVLCCRYLGPSAGQARERFAAAWEIVRPRLFGRTAAPPRIWAT